MIRFFKKIYCSLFKNEEEKKVNDNHMYEIDVIATIELVNSRNIKLSSIKMGNRILKEGKKSFYNIEVIDENTINIFTKENDQYRLLGEVVKQNDKWIYLRKK